MREETLRWQAGDQEHFLTVDTLAWYTWLEAETIFAFVGEAGTFTARKERMQRGGEYWKAYRKLNGRLYRAYLGKSSDLTLERLNSVAALLTRERNDVQKFSVGEFQSSTTRSLPVPLTSLIGREHELKDV